MSVLLTWVVVSQVQRQLRSANCGGVLVYTILTLYVERATQIFPLHNMYPSASFYVLCFAALACDRCAGVVSKHDRATIPRVASCKKLGTCYNHAARNCYKTSKWLNPAELSAAVHGSDDDS